MRIPKNECYFLQLRHQITNNVSELNFIRPVLKKNEFGFGKFQIMCFSGKRVRLKNQFGIKQIPLIREHVIIWDLH